MCTTVCEWSSEDSSQSGFALGIELSCQVWQQAPVKPSPRPLGFLFQNYRWGHGLRFVEPGVGLSRIFITLLHSCL